MDNENWSPLILAARYGSLEMVKILLDKGANPNLKQKDGWTAMMEISARDQQDTSPRIVELLLAKCADPKLKNPNGRTAFREALRAGRRELAQTLRSAVSPSVRMAAVEQ